LELVHGNYCAGLDASGAAQSWAKSSALQKLMLDSVEKLKTPIFFFQAKNDYDLTPSRTLAKAMKALGKEHKIKFYSAFGKSKKDGHSFAYLGSSIWFNDAFQFLQKHCFSK